ncbi:hypothetical protein BB560_001531 [Smittium megazygosporum]|uniref:Uncharacterized protein n=1 Tax=Smittium megazygosporum TaxID=133381 RepID=A0A2T9ZHA9_9FUNG|nr:hypothetical protein BB560_001531 [Smittium megazygosporum]
MSTRLDRLVATLENGTTPGVRMAAAQQLGAIQEQRPSELFNLLERIYKCLISSSWDSRIAASQAIEAISRNIPLLSPHELEIQGQDSSASIANPDNNQNTETNPSKQSENQQDKQIYLNADSGPLDSLPTEGYNASAQISPNELWLDFKHYNVDSVLSNGKPLLASAGDEFDYEDSESLIGSADLAKQKRMLSERLGLTLKFVDSDFIDVDDFIVHNPPTKPEPKKSKKSAPVESVDSQIDFSKLSARERNVLKRKSKKESKSSSASQAKFGFKESLSSKSSSTSTPKSSGIDITDQPGQDDKILIEAKKPSEPIFSAANLDSSNWPFEPFVDHLCLDLFHQNWEVRHGACLGLRELLKKQGSIAGMHKGVPEKENIIRLQGYLVDISVRLLCVLTLDRFADFVSDQVVTPVRETCAQVLGVISKFLNVQNVTMVESCLLKLISRGASVNSPIWEIRHSGLLGLKYVVSVRNDIHESVFQPIINTVLDGLRGSDDDVRSVSASALLSLVSSIPDRLYSNFPNISDALWCALKEIDDDLASSTAHVMNLLSQLCKQSLTLSSSLSDLNNNTLTNSSNFSKLVLLLFPFFRHAIKSVRLSSIEAMYTISSTHQCEQNASFPEWISGYTMLYLFQILILETSPEVLLSAQKLWNLVIEKYFDLDNKFYSIFTDNILAIIFNMLTTQIGVPFDPRLFIPVTGFTPDSKYMATKHSIDAPMLCQDLSLVSTFTIVRCRIVSAQAIAKLLSVWELKCHSSQSPFYTSFLRILSKCLDSNLSFSIHMSSVIIEELILMCMASQVFLPNYRSGNTLETSTFNLGLPLSLPVSEYNRGIALYAKWSYENCDGLDSLYARTIALVLFHVKRLEYSSEYRDLTPLLTDLRRSSEDLLLLFNRLLNVPLQLLPQIPPLKNLDHEKINSNDFFGIKSAEIIAKNIFSELISKFAHNLPSNSPASQSLLLKKQNLTEEIKFYTKKHSHAELTVSSSLAGSATAFGVLPPKLNYIIKPILNSVKLERNSLLQRRSALAAARMISQLYSPPNIDASFIASHDAPVSKVRVGPGNKTISNLINYMCSDHLNTPVLNGNNCSKNEIFVLSVVQSLANRPVLDSSDENSNEFNSNNHDAIMISSLNDANNSLKKAKNDESNGLKKRGRGTNSTNPTNNSSQTATSHSRKPHSDLNISGSIKNNGLLSVSLSPKNISVEDESDLETQTMVRGALYTLEVLFESMGSKIFMRIPALWDPMYSPFEKVYGQIPNWDSQLISTVDPCEFPSLDPAWGVSSFLPVSDDFILLADSKMLDNSCKLGQGVVDALSLIETLSPRMHHTLQTTILNNAPYWFALCLQSQLSAVRHSAAKAMATACKLLTKQNMMVFVRVVLPWFGDSDRVWLRQGVAETIYYITSKLDEKSLLPYIPFLIVPLLGRMSDSDTHTRIVSTRCFAKLLQLVPIGLNLHQKADNLDIAPVLFEQYSRDRSFLTQLTDSSSLEPFKIPIKVNATLRKYQQDGVNWLSFLNRYRLHGILCDDMGLGKTLQTICMISSDHYLRRQKFEESKGRHQEFANLPSIVVCPPTLLTHWEQEILSYVSVLKPLLYAGTPSERRSLLPRIKDVDVVIVSYDVLRNDIEHFTKYNYNYCVLDEGHIIKNSKAKLTISVKKINARNRLILTGTPVQNNVLELWSLFDFLMPGFLGVEKQFNDQFSKPILSARDPRLPPHIQAQAQAASQKALNSLHRQVLPFLLRRMKEDVLADLPPKIIQDRYCNLSEVQQMLIDSLSSSMKPSNIKLGEQESSLEDKKQAAKPGLHVFQALQYLRRICNHPALVLNPSHPLYSKITNKLQAEKKDIYDLSVAPKLQTLSEILLECGIGLSASIGSGNSISSAPFDATSLESINELDFSSSISACHRALIFCQHREMIDIIIRDLFQRHMPSVSYLRLDGTVEARKRSLIVSKFNSDPSIDVLMLTTHVGGLGLNLTGADTVIFVEHDWNPMMDLQAMDRAHRLGQTKVVNVYRLITKDTLEEKVMGLQAFKLNIAQSIVNQQNSGIQTMNTDEILDLFSPPATKASNSLKQSRKESTDTKVNASKAIDGLEELWDPRQYESEYNMDAFITSLKN